MFLIVGLGNPGAEYAATRHNAGFMAVDEIAESYRFSPFRNKFDGLVAEGYVEKEKCLLLKPQTYMNLSGNAVVKAASFYKILPQNIIVIHDDMDLPLGKIKAKTGGGTGGHNGLKSIDAAIGSDYHRIRLGIGHPQAAGAAVVNHVLSSFTKADRDMLLQTIKLAIILLPQLLENGMASFCSQLGMSLKK